MPLTLTESDVYPPTLQVPQAAELASAPGLVSQFLAGIANRTNYLKNRIRLYRPLASYDFNVTLTPVTGGTNFVDVVTLSTNRIWEIDDTGCVDGDFVLIRNRSAFSITLNAPGGSPTLATLGPSLNDYVLCVRSAGVWRAVAADLSGENIKRAIGTFSGVNCSGSGVFAGFLSTAGFIAGRNTTQFAVDTLTDVDQTVDRFTVHYGGALPSGACTWTINSLGEANGDWVKFHRGNITTNIVISSSSGTVITLSTGVAHWAECVRIGGAWHVVASGL